MESLFIKLAYAFTLAGLLVLFLNNTHKLPKNTEQLKSIEYEYD